MIPTRLVDLDSGTMMPYVDAISFSKTGSGTDNFDYTIPFELVLTGIVGNFSGTLTAGDYIKIVVIDKDNTLGGGANAIVANMINKWILTPLANTREEIKFDVPLRIESGLYIRVSYTSTNILSSANGRVNFNCNKVIAS